jgi:hypothetical protein
MPSTHSDRLTLSHTRAAETYDQMVITQLCITDDSDLAG